MAVRGVFMSNGAITGDRIQTFSSRILMNGYGGSAPLLALSAGMPEERVSDTSWTWTEDQHISGASTTTTNYNNSATSIAVADSNLWTPNTILLVEASGEKMFVTAISGNTITVVRGFAGTAANTIANGGRLQSIGTAFAEAGGKPSPVVQQGEPYSNIVQIFKNGWSISGTAQAIKYQSTGDRLAYNKNMALQYHAEDLERAFWWGTRGTSIVSGAQYRTTDGVMNMINQYGGLVVSANYGSVAGNMSLAGLQNFIRLIFDHVIKGMPNERIAFTSSAVLELIQRMINLQTTYYLDVSDSEYGFNVTTISFLGNKLKLMTHPMFVENPTWAKNLVVLHPGLIKKKILRNTWIEQFGPQYSNNAGVDAEEGYIGDELGFHLSGAKMMGYMTNITTAVAN